jgi:hypothetical protein
MKSTGRAIIQVMTEVPRARLKKKDELGRRAFYNQFQISKVNTLLVKYFCDVKFHYFCEIDCSSTQ